MNLCGKSLTEREGKSIGLAFFLVVAIKSNLSTFAAAKLQNYCEPRIGSDELFLLGTYKNKRRPSGRLLRNVSCFISL
jgi:hypothetical protein